MYKSIVLVIVAAFIISCRVEPYDSGVEKGREVAPISEVIIEFIHTDNTSIRAIEVRDSEVMYAGSQ